MSFLLQLKIQDPTPVVKHASKVFFEDLCGLSLSIVEQFEQDAKGIAVEYAVAKKTNAFFIQQHQNMNANPVLDCIMDEFKFPYATNNGSMMPFDPIALTSLLMFLPSEQLDHCIYDEHHRPVSDSLWVVKNGLYKIPLLDIAATIFMSELKKNNPQLIVPSQNLFFEPTFDIDMAFAHKAKPMLLHGLGTISLFLKRDFKGLNKRLNVWLKKHPDPYDVFNELLDVLEEHRLNAQFFAMTANRSRYDRNNNFKSGSYRRLLKRLSEKHVVGIHPGYVSAIKPQLISVEKRRLEDVLGKPVTHVRQHYLRQYLPETWHSYIENGLTDDYSVGFATHSGYKVGTCKPYQAFDVKNQQALPITLHPFALMDTALWHYQKYDQGKVMEVSSMLKSNQTLYNSPLSAVWHNYAMPRMSEEFATFIQQLSILKHHG